MIDGDGWRGCREVGDRPADDGLTSNIVVGLKDLLMGHARQPKELATENKMTDLENAVGSEALELVFFKMEAGYRSVRRATVKRATLRRPVPRKKNTCQRGVSTFQARAATCQLRSQIWPSKTSLTTRIGVETWLSQTEMERSSEPRATMELTRLRVILSEVWKTRGLNA